MAKMGKLTPEELARNKMLMRERDRDRKRIKRMNPEYRKAEQERDRDRKKARRSNEAFRQLEKLRDKIRKERKKGNIVDEAALTAELVNSLPTVPVEPEIIISDPSPQDTPGQTPQQQQQQTPTSQNNARLSSNGSTSNSNSNTHNNVNNNMNVGNNSNNNNNNNNNNRATNLTTVPSSLSVPNTSGGGGNNTNNNNHNNILVQPPLAPAAHAMPQLNKGLLYPPPSFAHHPLPIPGVALMPQLCHPILHQNLSATLYPPNGIKQEYNSDLSPPPTSSPSSVGTGSNSVQVSSTNIGGSNRTNNNNNADDPEMPLIEPEIILQTSTDVIASPHHFHNHAAHTHHLHQQQCNMFQHMTNSQTHHMRALQLPSAAAHAHQQQHQLQQHYGATKPAYESK